ncbi:hypothetical protein ASZ78_011042 [Callipepla squamata]|uniref:LYR motif-containing protein 2 n=1 Tax=Callipepla squamata TaxID=9009 RepID=A0A226MGM1_CALSU|nr:hypothetical protein ASZ78_011042 [Callipepla squamata]
MAASRLPPAALTLRQSSAEPSAQGCGLTPVSQFLRRQQVLQLYRRILRAIRDVPSEADRRHLQEWAREEFQRNKDATEEHTHLQFRRFNVVFQDAIRMMITQGHMQLQELQRALKLAKS